MNEFCFLLGFPLNYIDDFSLVARMTFRWFLRSLPATK